MALSAFNIADYQEKYRWTGKDSNNDQVQLRILEKTNTPYTVKSIRGLVDIRLQMQGAQNAIYAPLAKTVLTFTLVDAPDLSTASEKAGDWQEFFTPDSTAYLVQVYRQGGVTWQGYITPDSWQESLSYRGAITITARDNVGHCSDLAFDKSAVTVTDGLACIRDLIETALDAVYFPMALLTNVNTGDAQTMRDKHGYILDSYICISEFEGKTWGDVLEDCLHAIGYTLRYVGSNSYALAPIRNIPLGLATTRAQAETLAQDLEFYGGSRELNPAYKSIQEKIKYDAEMEVDVLDENSYKYGATTAYTYSGDYTGLNSMPYSFTGRSWKNGNTAFATKGGWSDTFGYLNPQRCVASNLLTTVEGAKAFRGVFLLAGQSTDGGVLPAWRCKAPTTDVTLRLEFGRPVQLDNGSFPFTVSPFLGYLTRIKALVSYIDPNGVKWSWQTFSGVNEWTSGPAAPHTYDIVTDSPADFPDSFALDIQLKDISDKTTLGGWLQIEFYNFIHVGAPAVTIYGLFERCTSIKATLNSKSVLKSDTVTTVNNSAYNVLVERTPAFAPLSAQVPYVSPMNYPKALWAFDANGKVEPVEYAAYLNGYASSTAIPLPAQIHKQLLCYNYTPLEVLEGSCGRPNKADKLYLGYLCTYKGKEYVIQGGTLDILRNRISGVRLHEFAWYADLWDENNNPSYSGTPKYDTDSAKNGANGNSAIASSSSGGGGGGSVNSVGLTAPTGFVVTGSPVTSSGVLQLTYGTGYGLPKTADVAKGVEAYSWGDHRTAGYLTSISYADVVAALGYTPASAQSSFQAPTLKIIKGYDRLQTLLDPYLSARHPLMGQGDACFVLMIYRKRRGKYINGHLGYKQRREKWGEARGPLASGAALTFAGDITLDTIREWVLNRYMCILDYALPTTMTVAQLAALTTYGHQLRFGRLENYTGADFKAKTKCWVRFGIALRITNPLWTAHANPGAVETTRQINYNGQYIRRYLYSDIAPLRIFTGSDVNKMHIGFALGQP